MNLSPQKRSKAFVGVVNATAGSKPPGKTRKSLLQLAAKFWLCPAAKLATAPPARVLAALRLNGVPPFVTVQALRHSVLADCYVMCDF